VLEGNLEASGASYEGETRDRGARQRKRGGGGTAPNVGKLISSFGVVVQTGTSPGLQS
jgi:hypothetical protein